MYRVLRALGVGDQRIDRGTLSDLKEMSGSVINSLIDLGLIAKVAAPPLAVLPNWQSRAKKLEAIGIENADQFLEADDHVLAGALKVSILRIDVFKQEIRQYLTGNPPKL